MVRRWWLIQQRGATKDKEDGGVGASRYRWLQKGGEGGEEGGGRVRAKRRLYREKGDEEEVSWVSVVRKGMRRRFCGF